MTIFVNNVPVDILLLKEKYVVNQEKYMILMKQVQI